MAEYHLDEAVLDLPSVWQDQSVQALWQPIEGTRDRLALTISREDAPVGKTLAELTDRAIELQRQRLTGFELTDRVEDLEVGGLPAIGLRVQWRNADGAVYHRHVYVLVYERLLAFTGTCKWPHRALCDERVDEVLSTLTFRERRP